MRDIYEAAEAQTALFAMQVENLARRRGWAARTLSGLILEPRMLTVYGASVLLPGGRAASFLPGARPRVDGDSWVIDIKRSDGVSRPAWNEGVRVARQKSRYALFLGGRPVDEAVVAELLDAVGTP